MRVLIVTASLLSFFLYFVLSFFLSFLSSFLPAPLPLPLCLFVSFFLPSFFPSFLHASLPLSLFRSFFLSFFLPSCLPPPPPSFPPSFFLSFGHTRRAMRQRTVIRTSNCEYIIALGHDSDITKLTQTQRVKGLCIVTIPTWIELVKHTTWQNEIRRKKRILLLERHPHMRWHGPGLCDKTPSFKCWLIYLVLISDTLSEIHFWTFPFRPTTSHPSAVSSTLAWPLFFVKSQIK